MAPASAKVEVLGKPVIVKSALELVQMVYRDPDLPLQVRLHAANIAIGREAQVSGGLTFEGLVTSIAGTCEIPAGN